MILDVLNPNLASLIFACLLAMVISLVGVIFVTKTIADWTESNMKYLIAFASGVFLVVSYNLINEALEFSTNSSIVWITIISGFLLFYILEKIYPESHCHHSDHRCLDEKKGRSAKRVLIGDALHNIGDGILLAPIFLIDIKLGFVATFGILTHELIQEISEFFVLKASGYSTKKALVYNFLVSSTILVGAIGSFYLTTFKDLAGPLIGLAAGAFIYILVVDLIPQSIKNSHKEKKYLHFLIWTLAGILVILSVNAFSAYNLEEQGLDSHGHLEDSH